MQLYEFIYILHKRKNYEQKVLSITD